MTSGGKHDPDKHDHEQTKPQPAKPASDGDKKSDPMGQPPEPPAAKEDKHE